MKSDLRDGAPKRVQNTSGETVPPFAVMELKFDYESGRSATFLDGEELVHEIVKPTSLSAGIPSLVLFNGPDPIADDGFGEGWSLPIGPVLFDNEEGDADPGGMVGPVAGSWMLSVAGQGYECVGYDSGESWDISASQFTIFVKGAGGAGGSRFFVTLEDFPGDGPCWAKWVTRTNNTSRGEFQIHSYDSIVDGALAGYKCICEVIEGEWVIHFGPCIETCASGGSIGGTPVVATVGSPYSFTPSGTSIDASSWSASNLPPGLSIAASDGEISGTPTEAGSWVVPVSGESAGTGDDTGSTCTVTRAFVFTVASGGGK